MFDAIMGFFVGILMIPFTIPLFTMMMICLTLFILGSYRLRYHSYGLSFTALFIVLFFITLRIWPQISYWYLIPVFLVFVAVGAVYAVFIYKYENAKLGRYAAECFSQELIIIDLNKHRPLVSMWCEFMKGRYTPFYHQVKECLGNLEHNLEHNNAANKGDEKISYSSSKILETIEPNIFESKLLFTCWIALWPMFLTKDLTIDLVDRVFEKISGYAGRLGKDAFRSGAGIKKD